jgi:HEAT repeat protein
MPIRFYCPECSKPLAIGTRKAGARIACPICKGEVTVPLTSNYFTTSPPEVDDNGAGSLCLVPTALPDAGPAGAASPVHVQTDLSLPVTAADVPAPLPLPAPAPVSRPAGEVWESTWHDLLPGAALVATLVLFLVIPVVVSVLGLSLDGDRPPQERKRARATRIEAGLTGTLAQLTAPAAPVAPAPSRPKESRPAPAAAPAAPAPAPGQPEPTPAPQAPPTKVEPPAPAAEAPKKAEQSWAEKWREKGRDPATDEDLRKQLLDAPEVALDAVPGSAAMLLRAARPRLGGAGGGDVAPLLMARRLDLAGLRPRMGKDCQLGKEHAEHLQALSRKLRLHLEASIPGAVNGTVPDPRPDPEKLRARLLGDGEKSEWLQAEAIPTLLQLLMAENKSVRLILVDLLAQIPGRQAAEALAARALFDLHPQVREAAVTALKDRPAKEYEPALLRGFQYPWAPVADHAAEALVLLGDHGAVPGLVALLEDKDVSRPYSVPVGKGKVTLVQELVRINHLGNCLLCHAPSFNRNDLVRGRVPIAGQPLPAPVSTPKYYEGSQGVFVHADTTYLKQDFSVCQPVPHPGPWPTYQRYDYMVRLRQVAGPELTAWQKTLKKLPALSPRQEALLFALRELTGKDLGSLPESWKDMLVFIPARPAGAPEKVEEPALVSPAGADRPGAHELKESTRQAFAQYLAQLPLPDLRAKLKDKDRDLRHAAVLACGLRKAESLVPDLMERMRDADPAVALDATRILKEIDPELPLLGEAQSLTSALADAAPERQEKLVEAYRAGEGRPYDVALAKAIPSLAPATRARARAALRERLAKASVKAVREGLHDSDREIRLAAVGASAAKKVWSLVPDLIPLAGDADAGIGQEARRVLRELTRQDLGPEAGAAVGDRLRAVAAWQAWWKRQATQ